VMKDSRVQIVRGPASFQLHRIGGAPRGSLQLNADLEAASRRYMIHVTSVYPY